MSVRRRLEMNISHGETLNSGSQVRGAEGDEKLEGFGKTGVTENYS